MAHATATLGAPNYSVKISASGHDIVSDEPPALGGANAGPAPYDLLLASLGSCTAITLKMYAERKGWDLQGVRVDLHYGKEGETARIERGLALTGTLTMEQKMRLADIAERTPVTLTLKGGITIETELLG